MPETKYVPDGNYESGSPGGYGDPPPIALPEGYMWIFNRNSITWQVAVRMDYCVYQYRIGHKYEIQTGRFKDEEGQYVTPELVIHSLPAVHV